MNQDLVNRVQAVMSKIDNLKVSKIETETQIKTLEERLKENMEQAKELGYNSIEELVEAQTNLENRIKKECEAVEKAFTEAGV